MVVVTRRRPPAPTRIQREVNRMMQSALTGSLLGGGHLRSWSPPAARWTPRIDMFEREGSFVIRAEVPGLDPEKDVEISVDGRTLTIRGERRREDRSEGMRYMRFESKYGSFERSLLLPEGTDPDAVTASHSHGILEVIVPRSAETTARTIPVTVEGGQPETLDA
jgi:HSP20 family protein